MLGARYDGLKLLDGAVAYLLKEYPGARDLDPQVRPNYEARVAVQLLESLHKLVMWCDYATFGV
jgi:hypothetical protein